ncbi:MAG: DUF3298 domain-containing protein [Bacteroidota bacterium]
MKKNLVYLKVILVQILFLNFYGCDMFTTKNNPEAVNDSEKIGDSKSEVFSYELTSFKKNSTYCNKGKEQCAEVVVQYPVYQNQTANYVNEVIQKTVKNTLYNVISEEKSPNISIEKMADLIIENYDDFISDFSDTREKWDINVSVISTFQKGNILSFSFNSEYYTGGAHSNSNIVYKVINTKTNKVLGLKDLISNKKVLTATAEKLFRKQKNLPADKNLLEEGYFFENGKFTINDNIGLNQNGLIIYFNNYEIAPYSMGPSAVFIPFYEIKDILKIKY